jgi:hypothetical protein
MNALAITSITNFIFASEVLLLAGMLVNMPKARFSAAWFWSGAMVLLGVAALIGGIDHGFFEVAGLPRYFIQRANWIVLGATTFFLLMATAMQFFSTRAQRLFMMFGLVQFVANTIVVLLIDSFLDVVLNYAPVMVLLLAMNFIGLKSGAGSWSMIVGIVILFAASAIQALGMDAYSPLDHNGLYHLVSMLGVLFLYFGGLRLRSDQARHDHPPASL